MTHSSSTLLHRLLARGKFRHVQVLIKLTELGSVQRTADAIGMTQSAVTQTLAYLERLVDTPLFHRHAKGMRPTAACTELLPVARQLLMGIAESAEVISARRQRGKGIARLITSVAAMSGLLLNGLPRFHAQHPDIQVHLREAEGDDQLLAVSRCEVDIVACRRPSVIPEGWQFTALAEDRFAVVCRAGHPAVASGALTLDALADQVWLFPPAGSAARAQFDRVLDRMPHPPHAHPLITRSPMMMWWMLRHHDVLAFLPVHFVRPLIDAGDVVVLEAAPFVAIEPLGLLLPAHSDCEAALQLSAFLQACCAPH